MGAFKVEEELPRLRFVELLSGAHRAKILHARAFFVMCMKMSRSSLMPCINLRLCVCMRLLLLYKGGSPPPLFFVVGRGPLALLLASVSVLAANHVCASVCACARFLSVTCPYGSWSSAFPFGTDEMTFMWGRSCAVCSNFSCTDYMLGVCTWAYNALHTYMHHCIHSSARKASRIKQATALISDGALLPMAVLFLIIWSTLCTRACIRAQDTHTCNHLLTFARGSKSGGSIAILFSAFTISAVMGCICDTPTLVLGRIWDHILHCQLVGVMSDIVPAYTARIRTHARNVCRTIKIGRHVHAHLQWDGH
jgi:hypothetical protein